MAGSGWPAAGVVEVEGVKEYAGERGLGASVRQRGRR